MSETAMFYVGVNEKTVFEARNLIREILMAQADEKTKRAALKAAVAICAVKNTSITGCTFYGAETAKGECE